MLNDEEKQEANKELRPLKAKLAGLVAVIIGACLLIWKWIHR